MELTLDGLASGLSISLDTWNLTTRFSLHEQITRTGCVEDGVRSRGGCEIR